MSIRRAQDERIEGTPDGFNAITEISDVPDTPTIGAATNVGTSRAYNNGSATVAFTANARGGAVTTYTATSTPGSFTGTGASSPVTVTGLQSATSYTFTVNGANSTGTSPNSAASTSITATTVPQAPTIGTASDGGTGTTASVTFTAGATGGSTITGYTVTSSPGSITGTGASSPITVSGLTAGTAYTFTVTATNANGTSTASAASNSVTPFVPSSFESIATATGTGSSGTITFSSIPGTYKHLQVRVNGLTAGANQQIRMRLNGDTSTVYTRHIIFGGGYTVIGTGTINTNTFYIAANSNGLPTTANVPGVAIVDVHDYASTVKNKTIKAYSGYNDNSGTWEINLASGVYRATTAVTSVTIFLDSQNWTTASVFSLYGIKG